MWDSVYALSYPLFIPALLFFKLGFAIEDFYATALKIVHPFCSAREIQIYWNINFDLLSIP